MKALPLTATVLAAALLLGGRPSAAADLDYGYVPPPDRYGSAYDDPRYRDLYAPEPPRAYRFEPRPYAGVPPPGPVPPGYVYREHDRFAEWGPGPGWRMSAGCLPRREIRRRLIDEGWSDFHGIEITGPTARVSARRPSGAALSAQGRSLQRRGREGGSDQAPRATPLCLAGQLSALRASVLLNGKGGARRRCRAPPLAHEPFLASGRRSIAGRRSAR